MRPLRAVLFDVGNTLLFLDYARLAEGVGSALGLPLTGEDLSRHVSAATQAMERAGGTDRTRAAAYLETLFLLGGVGRDRLGELQECLSRMHRQLHLWSGVAERWAGTPPISGWVSSPTVTAAWRKLWRLPACASIST